jgi:hypothetical protein
MFLQLLVNFSVAYMISLGSHKNMDEVTMLKSETEVKFEDLIIAGDSGDLGIVCEVETGEQKKIAPQQQKKQSSYYRIASPPPSAISGHHFLTSPTQHIIDIQYIRGANIIVTLLKNGLLSICHAGSGIAVSCYLKNSLEIQLIDVFLASFTGYLWNERLLFYCRDI